MRIVLLSRYQKVISRGVEVFAEELAKRLSKKHEVKIFSGSDADSLKKVMAEKPDIVVPLNGRWQSWKMSLGRIVGKYKLLIGGHSGIGKDDIWNILICRPDIYIALTEKQLNWAKRFAWGSRLVKIPNGIDLDKFNPKGEKVNLGLNKPVILSVGALVWYKHHERVIEAVSRLKAISLLIVGKGEDENKLRKLAEKKLKERFKIISLPYDKIPNIYRSVDLFTLPSWDREAFGIVYLEAMASNLPVVAPDDDSRKEIIGEGGILVDVSNADEYASAITQVLNTNWGIGPRKQAEKFSWDIIAKEYEKVLEGIIR